MRQAREEGPASCLVGKIILWQFFISVRIALFSINRRGHRPPQEHDLGVYRLRVDAEMVKEGRESMREGPGKLSALSFWANNGNRLQHHQRYEMKTEIGSPWKRRESYYIKRSLFTFLCKGSQTAERISASNLSRL